jgi:hypothetical protein
MSVEAMTWVYGHSLSTGPARAVMLVVCDTVNAANGYRFWMTRSELSKRAGVAPRTTQKALASLIASGELVRVGRGRPGRAAEYCLPNSVLSMLAIYRLTTQKRRHDVRLRGHDGAVMEAPSAPLTTTETYKEQPVLSPAENVKRIQTIRGNKS